MTSGRGRGGGEVSATPQRVKHQDKREDKREGNWEGEWEGK